MSKKKLNDKLNSVPEEKTMTVGGIIEHFKKYPVHLPVVAAWEGIYAPIKTENMFIAIPEYGETRDTLIIYVD